MYYYTVYENLSRIFVIIIKKVLNKALTIEVSKPSVNNSTLIEVMVHIVHE